MTIAKSLPQNVKIVDGKSVQVYVDEPSGIIYLKDIYGRVEPLSNYLSPTGQILQNIGAGAKVFAENSGLPAQLRTLTQGTNVVITQNANDIEIAVPSVTGVTLYRGSFYSNQTQTTTGNKKEVMTLNNTDISVGVSIVAGSKITFANAGDYDIQFSAQIIKTQGGTQEDVYIYLVKNGSVVPETNTRLTLANNNDYLFAAWNFFVTAAAGNNFEIGWYSTDQHIQLKADPAPVVGLPAIPSVIVTVNRVG